MLKILKSIIFKLSKNIKFFYEKVFSPWLIFCTGVFFWTGVFFCTGVIILHTASFFYAPLFELLFERVTFFATGVFLLAHQCKTKTFRWRIVEEIILDFHLILENFIKLVYRLINYATKNFNLNSSMWFIVEFANHK